MFQFLCEHAFHICPHTHSQTTRKIGQEVQPFANTILALKTGAFEALVSADQAAGRMQCSISHANIFEHASTSALYVLEGLPCVGGTQRNSARAALSLHFVAPPRILQFNWLPRSYYLFCMLTLLLVPIKASWMDDKLNT